MSLIGREGYGCAATSATAATMASSKQEQVLHDGLDRGRRQA